MDPCVTLSNILEIYEKNCQNLMKNYNLTDRIKIILRYDQKNNNA